jgi:predicted TIM-barrel fold metal-dependent hydrolase
MIYDIHTHPFGNPKVDLSDKVRTRRDAVLLRFTHPCCYRDIWGDAVDLTDLLLEDMDANGISKALLQPPVGQDPAIIAAVVRKHPDRFGAVFKVGGDPYFGETAHTRPRPTKAALREAVAYQVKELGFRGLGEFAVREFTAETDAHRIAKDLEPLMEVLAEFRMPMMIPTAWTQFGTPLAHGMPLFVDELAERFPEVPMILMKMGRGYEFIFEMCLAIAYTHTNIYLETSQSPAGHIARAAKEIGADRIMFGTDWTHTWRAANAAGGIYRRSLDVIDAAGLAPQDRALVVGGTAEQLFGA